VVARHVQQGHAGAGNQVLQVVERQVARGEDEVRVQLLERILVQRVIDLIGDRQDAR
jgi:hypothetical protein